MARHLELQHESALDQDVEHAPVREARVEAGLELVKRVEQVAEVVSAVVTVEDPYASVTMSSISCVDIGEG